MSQVKLKYFSHARRYNALSDLYEGYEYSCTHYLPSYLTITCYKGVFCCMCELQHFIPVSEESGELCFSLLTAGDEFK